MRSSPIGDLISPDMEVEEVVRRFPEAVKTLTRLRVICIQCGTPVWGSIAEAVRAAGLDPERVLREVNDELMGGP